MSNFPTVVSVAFPMAVPGVYDYTITEQFLNRVSPGMPVFVELRSRKVWGVAVKCSTSSAFKNLKPILDIKVDRWTDADNSLVKLYEWIASYYQCDMAKVFRPFMKKSLMDAAPKQMIFYRGSGKVADDSLTDKQQVALQHILTSTEDATNDVCEKKLGVSQHMVEALCKKGFLIKDKKTVTRTGLELSVAEERAAYTEEIILTAEQTGVVESIGQTLDAPSKPFLLHGITGSGKTHVYIDLVKKIMAKGKSAIVLVPEISLTPQTIYRFKQAVGESIAVIHSRMSEGERRDSLADCVTGKRRCVIGVRSAILVPVVDLGLIIVDEEHDGSYKQSDTDPRYNARDVAVMRGLYQKATVVLGSATPSLESYCNAQQGKYNLMTLTSRFGKAMLPSVNVVDMRQEHDENNWTLLSRYLKERIKQVLENGRQIILLMNRRGFSTFLLCKDCGHIYTCPSCSVNLIFHKMEDRLKCHQCGYEEQAPKVCIKCKGSQIQFKGVGIQKAEEYIREQFPSARVLRMDQDTTRKKSGHVDIIEAFEQREADILIGTQMVSKGLNFPGVALVGVLVADIGLHIPDFRASERTFQLLSQVAGRAGRADADGEVVIQSFLPEEPAILAAKEHDYLTFYNNEIMQRKDLLYPPYGKLVRIVSSSESESAAKMLLDAVAQVFKSKPAWRQALQLLGPSPAVFAKLTNAFRYCILIKATSPKDIGEAVRFMRKTVVLPKNVRLTIDVDPVNML